MTALLPITSSAFERAMDGADAARFPLPVDAIKSTWNPDDCPEHLLSFLAWSLSFELWDENWPEAKKREVCRNALHLHRLKTTPAGIRAHVDLVGATVRRIVRPPARGFLFGAMTDEQREAWLADLPQIRIYPFLNRAVARRRRFMNGGGIHRQFAAGYLRGSRGPALFGRRASFYDRGQETPVRLAAVEGSSFERILLARAAPARPWLGRGFCTGFLTTSQAARNVVTIRASDHAARKAIQRGAEPVDVRPERVAQRRTPPACMAFMRRHGGFLRPSAGPLLVYDRISLHDPDRMGARRKVRSWHGYGRFGLPDFTAEIRVEVPMRRPRPRSGRWHGSGFARAASMAPLQAALDAIGVSKALRDTVLVDTRVHAPVAFESSLRFGDFTFGQIREVN